MLSAANSLWMHTHHDPKSVKTKLCTASDPRFMRFYPPIASHGPNVANHGEVCRYMERKNHNLTAIDNQRYSQ